jgi:anaerobic C4-dicarboxylate transporter
LPQLNSGQTVWLFQLLFFLSTLIVQSEQQFKLTLVPSGDEQVVEAGSTVTVTCVLADYLILPGLSNVTWTAENRRKIQV